VALSDHGVRAGRHRVSAWPATSATRRTGSSQPRHLA